MRHTLYTCDRCGRQLQCSEGTVYYHLKRKKENDA